MRLMLQILVGENTQWADVAKKFKNIGSFFMCCEHSVLAVLVFLVLKYILAFPSKNDFVASAGRHILCLIEKKRY